MRDYALLRALLALLIWPDIGIVAFLTVHAGVTGVEGDARLGLLFVTWVIVLSGMIYVLFGFLLAFQNRLGRTLRTAVIRLALAGALAMLIAWLALAGLPKVINDPGQSILAIIIGTLVGGLIGLPLHQFARRKPA